jgi:hypothetical protein
VQEDERISKITRHESLAFTHSEIVRCLSRLRRFQGVQALGPREALGYATDAFLAGTQ